MTPLRSSLLCVLSAAAACHGDAVTNSPVPSLAAINFVHAASDAVVADFRVVDIVSNAGLFGAPFRGMNQFSVGIEAGTRHIKVFFDTTDVMLAKTVLLDTAYTFTADQHYTFMLYGFAATQTLKALIVQDAAPPAVPAGKFAIRIVNGAPSFAGAVPTLADTTVRPDAFVSRVTALPGGTPDLANVAYLGTSQYAMVDTGLYRVALTPAGTTGPVIVQATIPAGVGGTSTLNPIAGSQVSGSVLTAVVVARSVVPSSGVPSKAPQGGRPSAKATDTTAAEASRRLTRSNDTVTAQSGSVSTLTNRPDTTLANGTVVKGRADSVVKTTGTGAGTGVVKFDNTLVTGATQPEYNGWQVVIQLADSLSCAPVNGLDTSTKCAAANAIATTRFRFRYRITGVPVSPATGTPVYRIYPASTASDYTIPYIIYLVDKRPPNTAP